MEEQSLNIPDVSRATNISDSTIRSILTRKSKSVALDVAVKISKGLNVSLERFIGELAPAAKEQIPDESNDQHQYDKLTNDLHSVLVQLGVVAEGEDLTEEQFNAMADFITLNTTMLKDLLKNHKND